MTGSRYVRLRARRRRGAAWRPVLGAVVLAVLVAALPALWLLPASPGAVRVGGVSIEWWYGGLLAPVAGWAVAMWALRGVRDEPGGADGPAVVGDVSTDPTAPDPADVGAAPPERA